MPGTPTGIDRWRARYNDLMTDDRREQQPADGEPLTGERAAGPTSEPAPPDLAAARTAGRPDWSAGGPPGRWATIGCGLGVVVLIAALFAGSSLTRRTVWAGFAGARQRLVANLPGDLPPGERVELIRRLDALAAELERRDDPYPAMGELQRLVRTMLEDGQVTRDELAGLDTYLDRELAESRRGVPYSMP